MRHEGAIETVAIESAHLEMTCDPVAKSPLQARILQRVGLEGVDRAVIRALSPHRPGRQVWAAVRRVQVDGLGTPDHTQQILVGIIVEAGGGTPASQCSMNARDNLD